MSTIKVTSIQATGETASRAVSGVAAAWVNFNGTGTIASRDSNNVSSLTDSGTGRYDINFSNNTGNANYAYNVTCASTSSPFLRQFWVNDVANATSSKVQAQTLYASDTSGNGANSDAILVSVTVHGDLA
jgi:hypothetical protein